MYDEEFSKVKSLKNDSPVFSKQMSKNSLTIEEINQLLIKNLNRGYYLEHDKLSGQTNLSDVDHKLFESYKVNEINFDPSIHSKCEHKSNVYARECEISNVSKELISHIQKSLPKSLFQRIFNIENNNTNFLLNENNSNNELSNKEAYFYEEIYMEKFNIHLLDLIPKPMLSEPAKKFFLKHEINEENVELFYKTFGHIIPRNVYFGGKIYRITKMSEKNYNSKDNLSEIKNKKADFNFLIKEAQKNESKFQEQNSSCEWIFFGGDMNLRFDKPAWGESLEDPTKWEKIKIEYKYTIDLIIEYFEEDESFTKIKNDLENFIGQKEYYSPLIKEKKQDSQYIDEKNDKNFLNQKHLAQLNIDVKINNNGYDKHGITFLVNSSPFSSWYVCIVAENSECPSIFGKRKSQIKLEYIDAQNSENFYIILETNNNEKCYLYEKDDFSYFVGIGSCKLFFGYQNKAQVWKIKHYKDNLFTIQSKNNEFLQVGELGQLQKIYRIVKLGEFSPENSLWEIKNN